MADGGQPPPSGFRPGPRRIDVPRPGFFRLRLVKRGPFVPARIVCDFDLFSLILDGVQTSPPMEDALRVPQLAQVWHYATEIAEDEYQRLVARKPFRPDPRKPIDLAALPPLY